MASIKVFSCVVLIAAIANLTSASTSESALRAMKKIYTVCEESDELFKCMKIQALKLTDRALKVQNIKITDGLSIIKKDDANHESRSMNPVDFDSEKVTSMPSSE